MKLIGSKFQLLVFVVLTIALVIGGCGDDDDDDSGAPADDDDDDDAVDDDSSDDDTSDDDTVDDDDDVTDDDDDDDSVDVTVNPDAKADAFRLFYKERSERLALTLNRLGVAGDAVFANTFDKLYYAKQGNEYEVVPGPADNNPIGKTVWATWELYKAIGGRPLELTLIRLFEGLVFNEQVSGHSGLTCREALPGWTRVMDGVNDSITRTRLGSPLTHPTPFAPALEQEILDTFYDGVVFTYRENPFEYYYSFKPINELGGFAVRFVFSPWPDYLIISDCCSSWKISEIGDWQGSFWGNHNSRDNFTDYAMGYLAAFEAEMMPGLPADLALAASHAADAARRTGDAIADAGMVQMTVLEDDPYDVLQPGGIDRPDHHVEVEWQDLGSLGACQPAYLAQAISEEGLTTPIPEVPLPGDLLTQAIDHIFYLIGVPLKARVPNCTSVDEAFRGITWGQVLDTQVLGVPWYELADLVARIFPDLFATLLGSAVDDFQELVLGSVGLCYYAQVEGDDALYQLTRRNLSNMIEITYLFADLVYGIHDDKSSLALIEAAGHKAAFEKSFSNAQQLYYMAALYGRMFDLDTPLGDFEGFTLGESRLTQIEGHNDPADTTEKPLMTDLQIAAEIDNKLNSVDPWTTERYDARFGAPPDREYPVRRAGNGYEAIGPDGNWQAVENDHHRWIGAFKLWYEAQLCNQEFHHTLDCSWARLGCAPADLDDSGVADNGDLALFHDAWSAYGQGAYCDATNDYCDGGDLDGSGILDNEDLEYMNAALGCTR